MNELDPTTPDVPVTQNEDGQPPPETVPPPPDVRTRLDEARARRDREAQERELVSLREQAKQAEALRAQLDEIKDPARFAKKIKDLGINPKDLARHLYENHQDEILGVKGDDAPPDPLEQIKAELNELKKERESEVTRAKAYQEEQKRQANVNYAKNYISQKVDQYPTLASLDDEGPVLLDGAWKAWLADPANRHHADAANARARTGDQTYWNEIEQEIASALEEIQWESLSKKISRMTSIDKFKALLPVGKGSSTDKEKSSGDKEGENMVADEELLRFVLKQRGEI